MMQGIPKYISFPVEMPRSPTVPKVIGRRRAFSVSSPSVVPLSLVQGSGSRSVSRWLSCNSAPANVEVRLIRSVTDNVTSRGEDLCGVVVTENCNRGFSSRRSSLPAAVVPPRLPRRMHSDLELGDSSDEEEEENTPQKNATFVASSPASQDSSPKIPRRSWTCLTGSEMSLPNLGSLERHADATMAEAPMVEGVAPQKEETHPSLLGAELSRRHSSPALAKAVAAAFAA